MHSISTIDSILELTGGKLLELKEKNKKLIKSILVKVLDSNLTETSLNKIKKKIDSIVASLKFWQLVSEFDKSLLGKNNNN